MQNKKLNSRIKKVACGEKHSLILLENGELYAMGDDHSGQCAGAGDEYGNPIQINFELANKNNYSIVNNSGDEFVLDMNEDDDNEDNQNEEDNNEDDFGILGVLEKNNKKLSLI